MQILEIDVKFASRVCYMLHGGDLCDSRGHRRSPVDVLRGETLKL